MLKHKSKHPTPQELYRERVQREEQERDAFLPPGLINHGNTCFMNSTLQGLIATPLLHSLVNFEELPATSASLAARRSPQLTNGHGRGGQYEQARVQGMPLGDIFVELMQKAWSAQEAHRRESLSPKELLTTIGRKYDQYLDFRQQDAHEFLRHMLDAMRMEELDIIKARQPPSPKHRRRKSRAAVATPNPGSTPDAASSLPPQSAVDPGDPTDARVTSTPSAVKPDESEKLASFVDMLFGGKLASFLVCDVCKKVSVTYEDFNDLSLSIKPEDYVKERKRDRFKFLAKKLRFKAKELETGPTQRSSSVPASPVRRSMEPLPHDLDPPLHLDQRRRSLDHPAGTAPGRGEEKDGKEGAIATAAATPAVSVPPSGVATPLPVEELVLGGSIDKDAGKEKESGGSGKAGSHGHVGFVETTRGDVKKDRDKEKEKEKDDAWGKLGRRISVSMGMAKKEKRLSRSKERGWRNSKHLSDDKSLSSRAASEERPATTPATAALALSSSLPESGSSDLVGDVSDTAKSRGFTPSPGPSPLSSPALNASASGTIPPAMPLPNPRRVSAISLSDKLTKPITSSRPPKPSREESAYMRHVLADVHPSSQSAFSVLHQALSHSSTNSGGTSSTPVTAQALLVKLGQIPGIEECLRLFTAVEVLDGENMVGCHRCWKIANGTYKPRNKDEAEEPMQDESEEESRESPVAVSSTGASVASSSQADVASRMADTESSTPEAQSEHVSPASTPILNSATSSSLFLHETASVASAPTTILSAPLEEKTSESTLATYRGLPIPSISTTAPDTPDTSLPGTARVPVTPPSNDGSNIDLADSLQPPRGRRHRRRKGADGLEESSASSDEESGDITSDVSGDSYSDSSSRSPSVSPTVSPRASLDQLRESVAALKPPTAATPTTPKPAQQTNGKVPRSQQVILRKTFKRYLIAVPPPILVIHLKRFQQISKSNPYAMAFSSGFKKLDDVVSFPEFLDLTPFLAPHKEDYGLGKRHKGKDKDRTARDKNERCQYRLYAVVVHIGNMLGGHYVAYTALPPSSPLAHQSTHESSSSNTLDATPKPSSSEPEGTRTEGHSRHKKHSRQWAYISDQVVRLTTLEEVLKAKAYICMYERI